MGDMTVITAAEHNVLHKADSGGLKFKVRIPLPGLGPALTFTAKHKPFKELYKIILGRQTKVVNMTGNNQDVTVFSTDMTFDHYQEFWVTWYNKKLRLGVWDQEPFVIYPLHCDLEIGYLQFNSVTLNWAPVEWVIETSPVVLKKLPHKQFDDCLRWVVMENGKLPANAMIGGYQNEPIYIARAHHNNSLCPGKYVPSKGCVYVPWGHREHVKTEFEILCGYNAEWVKTKANYIPINAYIGGRSEVQNEPLYIGRAMHKGKLLIGKVHVRYKSCFLPYNGEEIKMKWYEILVIPQDGIPQVLPWDLKA